MPFNSLVDWSLGAGIVLAVVSFVALRPPSHRERGFSFAVVDSMRRVRRTFVLLGIVLAVGTGAVLVSASLHHSPPPPRSAPDSLRFLNALVDTSAHRHTRDSIVAARRRRSGDMAMAGTLLSDPQARMAKYDSAIAIDSANGYAYQYQADEFAKWARWPQAIAAAQRAALVDSANAKWHLLALGAVAYRGADTATSHRAIRAALRLDCRNSAAIRGDGRYREQLKRDAQARELVGRGCGGW
jgi:hypothetical protein